MKKILITLLMLSTHCTNDLISQTLGINTKAPDDFLVNENPPLVIPKDFALPEPETKNIHIAVEHSRDTRNATLSDGEKSLLDKLEN